MFKFKVGKRDEIKFSKHVPFGEAGEMLLAIQKLGREEALFIPVTEKEKDTLLNRYRSRFTNWRKNGFVPDDIKIATTEDGNLAIYHGVRRHKKTEGQTIS